MSKPLLTSVSTIIRCPGQAVLAMGAHGCALVSVHVKPSGVDIETVSTRTAGIISAWLFKERWI